MRKMATGALMMAAAYAMRWTRRIVIVSVVGYAIAEVGLLLGLSETARGHGRRANAQSATPPAAPPPSNDTAKMFHYPLPGGREFVYAVPDDLAVAEVRHFERRF